MASISTTRKRRFRKRRDGQTNVIVSDGGGGAFIPTNTPDQVSGFVPSTGGEMTGTLLIAPPAQIQTDNISEYTLANGVTVEEVNMNAGDIQTNGDIDAANGIVEAGEVWTDLISEATAGAGVTIDGVELKDGAVTGYMKSVDIANNYDKYVEWLVKDGIYNRQIVAGDAIEFASGTDMQVQYDGYAAGVHTITFDYTGSAQVFDGWSLFTEGVSRGTIANNEKVDFIGGTNVNIGYNFNSGTATNEITVNATPTDISSKVDVAGDTMTGALSLSYVGASINLGSGGNNGPHGMYFYDAVGTVGIQQVYRTSPETLEWEDSASANLMTLDKSGNLTVYGNIYGKGSVESYDTSDIRLKDNIEDIELNKALRLLHARTISFDHKHRENREIGLIAQEIKEIFPEVVKEDKDGFLMINYSKLTAALLTIIKHHDDRLTKLEKTVYNGSTNKQHHNKSSNVRAWARKLWNK